MLRTWDKILWLRTGICSILFPILQEIAFLTYSLKPHFQHMTIIKEKNCFCFCEYGVRIHHLQGEKASLAFCLFLLLLSAYCFHFFFIRLLLVKCHINFNNSA